MIHNTWTIQAVMDSILSRVSEPIVPGAVFNTLFTDQTGSIEYRLNEYCHRTPSLEEFKQFPEYCIALGCSHTFGLGVDKAWPEYLEEIIGMPVYNAGVPGATVYDMVDIAKAMFLERPYKKAILFAPHCERFLVKDHGLTKVVSPHIDLDHAKKMSVVNTETRLYYAKRALDEFRMFCLYNKVEHYVFSWSSIEFIRQTKNLIEDEAVDQLHYGPQTQTNIAEYIHDFIKTEV